MTGPNRIDWRPRDRADGSRDRRAYLPRVRVGTIAEANCEDVEPAGRRWPVRWQVESKHSVRKREARHRNPEQRAVRRPHGVESLAVREEPRHGQARVAAESGIGVDHDCRSAPADHSGRTLVGRERPAETHATCNHDDGQALVEELVREAIERLIEYDDWFVREVKKGLAQIDQGRTLTQEEVGARLKKYLTDKSPR